MYTPITFISRYNVESLYYSLGNDSHPPGSGMDIQAWIVFSTSWEEDTTIATAIMA